jgi:hypothetical protein
MSKTRSAPVTDAWDVGARVAIFGAADADRWVTLEPLDGKQLRADIW